MKYLIFDTETTGFPPKGRLVSIAWQIWDDENFLEKDYYIIKPEGFYIPDQATRVHGITTEMALEQGEDLNKVLSVFAEKLQEVDAVVAHNYRFDSQIVKGEFERMNFENHLEYKQVYDTMLLSTNYVKIRNSRGYKWPTLSELHQKLFYEDFNDAHSADADVDATAKCFFELKRRGVIN